LTADGKQLYWKNNHRGGELKWVAVVAVEKVRKRNKLSHL